jgi:uncharacterized protein (TIGR03067 family)
VQLAKRSPLRQNRFNPIMKTLVATLALLFIVNSNAADKPNLASEVVGTWSCSAATINGRVLPETSTKKLHLTITDTRYKTERDAEVLFDSTYRLDISKTPAHINMLGTEGDLRGKEAQGIIAMDGDTLKICYTMPGKPRPTTFASETNSEAQFVIWKREKK